MTIRPLDPSDLTALGALHRASFGTGGRPDETIDDLYLQTFPTLFEPTPPGGPDVRSLVYEQDGRIIGLLGVAVRALRFERLPVWAAVTSQLCVDPEAGNALAGVQLVRTVFDGPQDLTFADRSNPAGRLVLVGAGGSSIPGHGLRFARLLRPTTAALGALRRRRSRAAPSSLPAFGSLAGRGRSTTPNRSAVLDRLTPRIDRWWPGPIGRRLDLPPPPVNLLGLNLTADEVADRAETILRPFRLRPRLDDQEFVTWRWDRLERARPGGDREMVGLCNRKGKLVGWYILHQPHPELVELVELAAQPGHRPAALLHAFHRAANRGAASIHGDVTPHLQTGLADLGAVFHGTNANFTAHSRRPELIDALQAGEAFLSGLDGEYLLDLGAASQTRPRPGATATATAAPPTQVEDEAKAISGTSP